MSNATGSTPPRDAGRRTFVLHLVDAGGPDDAPVINRLRSFLKAALRSYHLRCTHAVEGGNTANTKESAR